MPNAERSNRLMLILMVLALGLMIAACDDPDPDPPGKDSCCGYDAAMTDGSAADTLAADSEIPDAPANDLQLADTSTDSAPTVDGGGTFKPGGTDTEIVRACIKLAACNKIWTASECLALAYGRGTATAPYMSCVGKGAAGCGDITTCMGMTYAKGTCTTDTYKCVGNKMFLCSPTYGVEATLDCPQMFGAGTSCVTTGSSAYAAGCSQGNACSGSNLSLHCSGNKMATCVNSKEILVASCPTSGLTCRDGACAGPDEACVKSMATCESGGVIAYCIGDYRARMACGALGASFSCKPSTATGARCQKATQCDPDKAKGTELCTGTKLTVCNAGETVQVDCKALGFTGCAAGSCTF